MAKGGQLIDLIERHVEKAVLGICLLLLGAAMIHWVASSPRKMEMPAGRGGGTHDVSPANVDAELLELAKAVQTRNDEAPQEIWGMPDYVAEIHKLQDQSIQKESASFVELAYPRAELDIGPNVPALQTFAVADFEPNLPSTSRPEVKIAQELIRKSSENNVDVIAAHVVAEFDYGQLQQQWDQKLQNTALRGQIVFLGVDAEVQERNHDGTWGPSRTVSMVRDDEDRRRGRYGQIPAIPSYDGRNARDVEIVVDELEKDWQEHILQPDYWDIMGPSEWLGWRVHLPETAITAIAKDPNRTIKTRMERRPVRTLTRRIPHSPARWDDQDYRSPSAMEDMWGAPPPIMMPPSASKRTVKRRPSGRASRRPPGRATPKPTPIVEPEKPELLELQETPVLTFDEQLAEGAVLVWFHDISLVSMKEYRYRVRLTLVSPLLARDGYVKDPNDAKVVAIVTPFSQWSTPVRAPRDTDMFLTGSNRRTPMVVVNVFTRHLGQSIEHSFPVKQGDPIGKKTMAQFIDRNDGMEKSAEIDFSTGAIAVNFDFKKVVPKGPIFKETVEMLYLDETGKLRSTVTIHDIDRTRQKHERFKNLQMELNVPENTGMLR